MSKGSNRRPGDTQAFSDTYARIFSGKIERGSFVFDPEQGKLVPKSEYVEKSDVNAPMVMGDIQPYKSMVTGEVINSRSTHRQHLKEHRLVEIGNETRYISQQKRQEIPKGLKETIAQQVYTKLK